MRSSTCPACKGYHAPDKVNPLAPSRRGLQAECPSVIFSETLLFKMIRRGEAGIPVSIEERLKGAKMERVGDCAHGMEFRK